MRTVLSSEDRLEAVKLRKESVGVRAISRRLDCHWEVVNDYLVSEGLADTPEQHAKKRSKAVAKFRGLVRDGEDPDVLELLADVGLLPNAQDEVERRVFTDSLAPDLLPMYRSRASKQDICAELGISAAEYKSIVRREQNRWWAKTGLGDKLSDEQVEQIKSMIDRGESRKAIALRLGIKRRRVISASRHYHNKHTKQSVLADFKLGKMSSCLPRRHLITWTEMKVIVSEAAKERFDSSEPGELDEEIAGRVLQKLNQKWTREMVALYLDLSGEHVNPIADQRIAERQSKRAGKKA